MTSIKRIRTVMSMEGRRLPTSTLFMRDCQRDLEDGSASTAFSVRCLLDQHALDSERISYSMGASTEFEREFFEEALLFGPLTGTRTRADKNRERVIARWHKRQRAAARSRRKARLANA
jgi:hypothetical protein